MKIPKAIHKIYNIIKMDKYEKIRPNIHYIKNPYIIDTKHSHYSHRSLEENYRGPKSDVKKNNADPKTATHNQDTV